MSSTLKLALMLGAPVLAAYLNSFSGSFQFDDFNVIVDNAVVHSLAAWSADLGVGIRPILKLSYVLNWITSPDAFNFHLFNLAIHLVNTWLVFLLAQRLVEGFMLAAPQRATLAALGAAMLFGLHPAQTEAITYISGRSGSLMATFYLGSVLSYIHGVNVNQRSYVYVLSPILFVLAMATKEVAISLPFALLLLELTRREPTNWIAAARRLSVHALVGVTAMIALLGLSRDWERLRPELAPQILIQTLLTQIEAVSYLVSRLLLVYPLNIDPDLRLATNWSAPLAFKAAMLIALFMLSLWALRRRTWWTFAILWFFIQLVPTNSIVARLDLANDRHLYLACVGVFTALGIEIQMLRDRVLGWRPVLGATSILILITLAALTALRNRDYRNEIALWEQTVLLSPNKARPFNNLGFAYDTAGCFRQAERAYREALRLKPDYSVARDNLASSLERAGGARETNCKSD